MPAQKFFIEIRTGNALLTHSGVWQSDCQGPKCVIDLAPDGNLSFRTDSVGKFSLIGDLELTAGGENGSRLLRWNQAAMAAGTGSCQVIVGHPKGDFGDLEIYVTMREESSLSVDEPEAESPDISSEFVCQYGAFICCAIAAIGALLFALLMPAYRFELISGASSIGIAGFYFTESYDRFVWRIVGFVAAGLTMCFAMVMADNAELLIGGAGVMCALAIICGDE